MSRCRIVCVCTGNVCRSPALEVLLADALGPGVEVSSAGTAAALGEPMDPLMLGLVAAHCSSAATERALAHRARRFDPRRDGDADLIITAGLDTSSAVLRTAPRALRRTFTVCELARCFTDGGAHLAPAVREAGQAEAVVELTSLASAARLPREAAVDNVPDTHGRDEAVFEASWELMHAAADVIIREILGNPDLPPDLREDRDSAGLDLRQEGPTDVH